VAALIELEGDGLLSLRPHPDVDELQGSPLALTAGSLTIGGSAVEITVTDPRPVRLTIEQPGKRRAVVSIEPNAGRIGVERPGFDDAQMPLPHSAVSPSAPLRVLLDADVLEVFGPGSYGAFRIAPASDSAATSLLVDREGAQGLSVVPMTGR
jgi:hypothetical protein